jgi:hypothetical protein
MPYLVIRRCDISSADKPATSPSVPLIDGSPNTGNKPLTPINRSDGQTDVKGDNAKHDPSSDQRENQRCPGDKSLRLD